MEPGQVILYLFLKALFVFWLILLVSMFIPEHKKKPLSKEQKNFRGLSSQSFQIRFPGAILAPVTNVKLNYGTTEQN